MADRRGLLVRRVALTGGRAALVLALAVTPGVAHSQDMSSLTLQAAIDRALAANPAIAAARLNRAINDASVAVAGERLNPEATIEFAKETPKQAYGLAFPLELGGKRGKRVAVSEAARRAGDAELAATIAQIRNDVRRAYFDARFATERLAVLRELGDIAQRARDTAQTRFDRGDVARLEVLQADLALSSAQIEATTAEGEVLATTARLNALLGLPVSAATTLAPPADAASPVAANSLVELARSQSAELTLLDRGIEEQRARLQLAHALRVPDVTPSATLTRDAEPEFDTGWRAGLTMTVPLFTTHKAGVTVEDTTLAKLMADREATRQRIEGEVVAAAASAEAQRQAYLRYQNQVLPRAAEVEQLAQDAYRLGQTGIAALLQALQASRDVRLRALDTASQFQSALATLEQAVGAPLP